MNSICDVLESIGVPVKSPRANLKIYSLDGFQLTFFYSTDKKAWVLASVNKESAKDKDGLYVYKTTVRSASDRIQLISFLPPNKLVVDYNDSSRYSFETKRIDTISTDEVPASPDGINELGEHITCSSCGKEIIHNQRSNAAFGKVPYPYDNGLGLCTECATWLLQKAGFR